jgi:outer membrane protein assembly factor BamA
MRHTFCKSILINILLFSQFSLLGQSIITQVEFAGISKTQEHYLRYFIQSKENTELDSSTVQKDVQSLYNLLIFSKVTYSISETDTGKILIFNCTELYTLLPIVNFGGVTNNFWFQVGAMDFHWLGLGHTLGGYYRYYDRHSMTVYLKAPYLFKQKWGLSFDIGKFSTIEPAYFSEGEADYNVDHWNFLGHAIYNYNINSRVEFGGGYLYELYDKNKILSGKFAPGPDQRDYHKVLVKFVLLHNTVDYYYQYLNGFSNELNLENVTTLGEYDLFWKILNISKLFIRTGKQGNLAFRLRVGISTNKDSPFVPFVLDNYINVRGSGNRSSRGTAEFTINAEYRHTIFEHELGAVQGVVFSDMSAWRPAAGKFSQMFTDDFNVTFAGIGVRFYFKKIYNFILRFDFGKSVTGNKGDGFVFGAGQYF